jgi:hypothetical protein
MARAVQSITRLEVSALLAAVTQVGQTSALQTMLVIQAQAAVAVAVVILPHMQQAKFRYSQLFWVSLAVTVLLVPIKQVAAVAVQLQSDLPR